MYIINASKAAQTNDLYNSQILIKSSIKKLKAYEEQGKVARDMKQALQQDDTGRNGDTAMNVLSYMLQPFYLRRKCSPQRGQGFFRHSTYPPIC
jgi:hypothetical protein